MTDEPEETALYHVYGDADLLLYIGISNDFGRRWKQHAKTQLWWPEKRRLTTLWYDSREEAKEAETAAITAEKPKYNIVHNGTPATARRSRQPVRAKAAGPAWIPVRIPDREMAPVHPADKFMPLGRWHPRSFTMAELTFSAVATAESFIADLPEENREVARMKLGYWRANYEMHSIAWKTLQDLYVLELTEDRAGVLAKIRSAKATCREFLEMPCPCCTDKPPAGMTCSECGAAGPVFAIPGRARLAIAADSGTAA